MDDVIRIIVEIPTGKLKEECSVTEEKPKKKPKADDPVLKTLLGADKKVGEQSIEESEDEDDGKEKEE